ncbi:hypothetical protein PQX77_013585 [Marasmius sp. AFHP31]|nr:hypothetical protein PQX77_013585 [Marasmius sp. AFHP31]
MSPTLRCFGDISIRGKQQFQKADGNICNYYFRNEAFGYPAGHDCERGPPIQGRFREVPQGDVILHDLVYSGKMEMMIKQHVRSTNPFRARIVKKRVKIRKRIITAELIGFKGERFTLVILEPEHNMDHEVTLEIWNRIYNASCRYMSPVCTQVFGLGRFEMPVLVLHDELANGKEFLRRHKADTVVHWYLSHAMVCSFAALRADNSFSNPLSDELKYWTFNLKKQRWQFDIASASVSPPTTYIYYSSRLLPPLLQDTCQQLDANEIIAWSERNFGCLLSLIGVFGYRTRRVSDFARHHTLALGTVVHRRKGTVARFPSIPPPEWSCQSLIPNLEVGYSKEVLWRVDFPCHRPGAFQIYLHFSLRFRKEDRTQLGAAYLTQSLNFLSGDHDDPEHDLVFISEINFGLVGNFARNPTENPTPVYLFVPPVPVEHIDGIYRVPYPLPDNTFYWSRDPEGKEMIPEQLWNEHGIPKLRAEMGVGSYWYASQYSTVQGYLQRKGYDLDGKKYARDHGYPELVPSDSLNRSAADHSGLLSGETPAEDQCKNSTRHARVIDSEQSDIPDFINAGPSEITKLSEETDSSPKLDSLKRRKSLVWESRGDKPVNYDERVHLQVRISSSERQVMATSPIDLRIYETQYNCADATRLSPDYRLTYWHVHSHYSKLLEKLGLWSTTERGITTSTGGLILALSTLILWMVLV